MSRRAVQRQAMHHCRQRHVCAHGILHRLGVGLVLAGWLYGAGLYGLRGLAWVTLYAPSGESWFLSWVLGGVGLAVVILWLTGALYALSLGRCLIWFPEYTPVAGPGRITERIILSPDAAWEHLGIRGTVTIERDTHM